LEPRNATAWRNLGIAYFNVRQQPTLARRAYERAFRARPGDARLFYERDQLWKRLGVAPAHRRQELLRHQPLVRLRDDLTVEMCALHNQLGSHEAAERLLARRRFQPWEGGEGLALGQQVRTQLALGRRALDRGDASLAVKRFRAALEAPDNLGEASHLLANQSEAHFWLGCAQSAAGFNAEAKISWTTSAEASGDFQSMSVRAYSEMTYFSALALRRLGRQKEARELLRDLLSHARQLGRTPARIDYFATSLPTMLLFDDDLAARQKTTALFLEAQARLALGKDRAKVRRLLDEVLKRDPNHTLAADLRQEMDA
jgi:tetratricopeptide (TPR) repeat protein